MKFFKSLITFFDRLSRVDVEYKIANQLWRTEYRNHSFTDVLEAVQQRSLDNLNR